MARRSKKVKEQPKVEEDEEEDEDYNPDEDPEANQDEDEDDAMEVDVVEPASHLSSMQQQQVDSAFERIFGYKWGQSFRLLRNPTTKQQRILCDVLGPQAAASIMRITSVGKKKMRPSQSQQAMQARTVPTNSTITSKVTTASVQSSSPAKAAASAGGVDQLLKDMEGPAKETTIKKTSTDWDKFKTDTGLANKLEERAESKQAYLNRQDFLTRVDHRTFEVEKKGRDRERAKRGK